MTIVGIALSRLAKSDAIFYAVPRAPFTPATYCQCLPTIDAADGAPHAQCSAAALVDTCRFDESKCAQNSYTLVW
jgi:hypothetical protein